MGGGGGVGKRDTQTETQTDGHCHIKTQLANRLVVKMNFLVIWMNNMYPLGWVACQELEGKVSKCWKENYIKHATKVLFLQKKLQISHCA